jgi:hypothetical protein
MGLTYRRQCLLNYYFFPFTFQFYKLFRCCIAELTMINSYSSFKAAICIPISSIFPAKYGWFLWLRCLYLFLINSLFCHNFQPGFFILTFNHKGAKLFYFFISINVGIKLYYFVPYLFLKLQRFLIQ